MIKYLQRRFALSRRGAIDMIKGSFAVALQNMALMVPVGLLYQMVCELMDGGLKKGHAIVYIAGCIICIMLLLLTTWLQYNGTYLATYRESGVRRINLTEHLRRLPLSFFGKKDLADLTSTIMNDCTALESSQSHFVPQLLGSMISTILIAVSLFVFDWRMALAALWMLPIAYLIVGCSARIQQYFGSKSMEARIACADGIQECVEAIKDLKSNNMEGQYLCGLTRKIKNVEKKAIAAELGIAFFVQVASLLLKLGIASVALAGSIFLVEGTLSIQIFFMFLLVASRLYDPMIASLQNLAALIGTRTSIDRMNEILDYPVQTGGEKMKNKGYDIVFDRVGFQYDKGETVLSDVSFVAKQGQVTALVGPSGGGKTTVSRLAARFWDCNRGKITVGGMDISKIEPETLLSLYSIVFQDVTLFNNTILENIRIGKKDASDEEVLEAARLANCDAFAEKLPDGWNTMIGENGCALSGGERQRISIARAFLKNAPILLLDEATASLDVENETQIQAALSRLIQNKTVLVIAHRMRTVIGSDKVVVLKEGRVAEEGNPVDLLHKDGIFAHMSNLQTKALNWTV